MVGNQTKNKTVRRGNFGKMFAQAFHRSMRGAGESVFAVWAYVVSHAEPTLMDGREVGMVTLNPEEVAGAIGCEIGAVNHAVEFLCAPDPKSSSKKEEGRRMLKRDEWTYEVVNFMEYRDWSSTSPSAVKNRERQERWRQKHLANAEDRKVSPAAGVPHEENNRVNFPENETDVRTRAAFLGLVPSEAIRIWQWARERGGKDREGIMIRDFDAYLKASCTTEAQVHAQEMDALERKLARM